MSADGWFNMWKELAHSQLATFMSQTRLFRWTKRKHRSPLSSVVCSTVSKGGRTAISSSLAKRYTLSRRIEIWMNFLTRRHRKARTKNSLLADRDCYCVMLVTSGSNFFQPFQGVHGAMILRRPAAAKLVWQMLWLSRGSRSDHGG